MTDFRRFTALAALALLGGAAAAADNCESIAAQIEARMRAGGLRDFTLAVVDASVQRPGRVVGTCGNGLRRIVYAAAAGPVGAPATAGLPAGGSSAAVPRPVALPPAPRSAPADRVPTECRDGSVVIGPDCNDPRAPRMTRAEIEAAAAAEAAGSAASAASSPAPAASSPAPAASAP